VSALIDSSVILSTCVVIGGGVDTVAKIWGGAVVLFEASGWIAAVASAVGAISLPVAAAVVTLEFLLPLPIVDMPSPLEATPSTVQNEGTTVVLMLLHCVHFEQVELHLCIG